MRRKTKVGILALQSARELMEMEKYEADLIMLFQEAQGILEQAINKLQELYSENGLEWSKEAIKGLSGDIHAKVLGKYLNRKTHSQPQYEVKITPSGKRADVLISGVEIDSKAQGVFDLSALTKRWQKVSKERPDLKHIMVGWRHNPSWAKRIRRKIGKQHHFMLFNLKTKEYQPQELERLVELIKRK